MSDIMKMQSNKNQTGKVHTTMINQNNPSEQTNIAFLKAFKALKLMEKRDISNEITINKSNLYDFIEQKENLINIDLNKLFERKKWLEKTSYNE